jgi:hypothetical protein
MHACTIASRSKLASWPKRATSRSSSATCGKSASRAFEEKRRCGFVSEASSGYQPSKCSFSPAGPVGQTTAPRARTARKSGPAARRVDGAAALRHAVGAANVTPALPTRARAALSQTRLRRGARGVERLPGQYRHGPLTLEARYNRPICLTRLGTQQRGAQRTLALRAR